MSGKPRGLRWSDVAFDDDIVFARDRKTGDLRALVAIEVCFEAIEGGGMEEVEAVSNVRAGNCRIFLRRCSLVYEGASIFQPRPEGAYTVSAC